MKKKIKIFICQKNSGFLKARKLLQGGIDKNSLQKSRTKKIQNSFQVSALCYNSVTDVNAIQDADHSKHLRQIYDNIINTQKPQ